jgi:hypothetical protein
VVSPQAVRPTPGTPAITSPADQFAVDLFEATLTLSPLLMVTAGVLFGQKAAQERKFVRKGKLPANPHPLNRWAFRPQNHKHVVRAAGFAAAAPPALALGLSVFEVAAAGSSNTLKIIVSVALLVQIAITAVALWERVVSGLPLPGES